MNRLSRGFASDNNSGIHPAVLNAIHRANSGHCRGYGDDLFTESAVETFKEQFGNEVDVYFVFTGTASNVLGIRTLTHSYNTIFCAESSHLNVDECGAPEYFTGCKVLTLPSPDGKISSDQIRPHLDAIGNEHQSQPRVVSITQPTELGTVYSIEELKHLARFSHENGMLLHMDGARLCNAAVNLGCSLREISGDTGIDVLSFGGTKNGMMNGEAIVFFKGELSRNFKYIRKQGMHLASKMRFISAQFIAFFEDDLWMHNAVHANDMARILAGEIENIPECSIVQNVEANAVFAIMPGEIIDRLRKKYFFYVWDSRRSVVRLMTSFDTKKDDINGFVSAMKELIAQQFAR
jgi:threonine aldolase